MGDKSRPTAYCNQDLKAILPTTGVHADFLAWLLRGRRFR